MYYAYVIRNYLAMNKVAVYLKAAAVPGSIQLDDTPTTPAPSTPAASTPPPAQPASQAPSTPPKPIANPMSNLRPNTTYYRETRQSNYTNPLTGQPTQVNSAYQMNHPLAVGSALVAPYAPQQTAFGFSMNAPILGMTPELGTGRVLPENANAVPLSARQDVSAYEWNPSWGEMSGWSDRPANISDTGGPVFIHGKPETDAGKLWQMYMNAPLSDSERQAWERRKNWGYNFRQGVLHNIYMRRLAAFKRLYPEYSDYAPIDFQISREAGDQMRSAMENSQIVQPYN